MAKRLATKPILFYMIHADRELYDNLYRFNYESGLLYNVTMFGNRLTTALLDPMKPLTDNAEPVVSPPPDIFEEYNIHELPVPLEEDRNGLFHTALTPDTVFHVVTERSKQM